MTDPDPLSNLLARWQPRPGPAPGFAAGVHARIARAARTEAMPAPSLLARLLAWPASLPLAAAFAVVIGTASALGLQHARTADIMADAYALSIDPVRLTAATAPADHTHQP